MKTSLQLLAVAALATLVGLVTMALAGRFGGGGHAGGAARPSGGISRPSGGFSRPGGGGAPLNRPQIASRAPAATPRPQIGNIHSPYAAAGTARAGTGVTRPGGTGSRPNSPITRPGEGGAGERHVWQTPGGGTIVGGGGQRSFTGPGGNTYGGGGGKYAYSGPRGGVVVGGGKAGSITGPGGNEIAGGKAGHVVIGPNGNVHAGGSAGAGVKGPDGAAIAGKHGAATIGPNGAAAHGSRGGIASGPNGTIAGGARGAAAVGPYGAVAAGGRAVAGRGPNGAAFSGTHFVAAADLRGQGAFVRNSFHGGNYFTPTWHQHYPGAWFAAGWVAGSAWRACTWADCSTYFGYSNAVAPIYYNYGDNVTYQDGSVYYGDQVYATQEQFADQSAQIAAAGLQATPPPDDQWQSLGVFAMVQGDETNSNDLFQLALDANGTLRGNYYNAISDSTTPLSGSLDKTSQRLAWTLDGKKTPVYETGLYNVTQAETTMLVHFGKDRTEQYKLFRLEQPENDSGTSP